MFGSNTGGNTTGGGLFGNTSGNTGGGLFGGSSNTNTTGNTGGGLFGSSTTTTSAAPASTGGGLFGSSNTTTSAAPASTGGGLFGSSTTTTSAAPASTGGGLFGGSSAAKPTESKPAGTGGLFGSSTTSAAKPAESTTATDSKSAGTGGLFGSSTTSALAATSTATTAVTSAPANTGLEAIYYDRMDDTLNVWDKRMKQQIAELGIYYKNMTSVDEDIERSHRTIIQLEKEQDEAEKEQHDLCVEMKALESKQIATSSILSELESALGQIIDSRVNSDTNNSYMILTEDHPCATLQDHFHSVTKTVEKAEIRAEAYQKRLATSLNNLAQMNGFTALVELLNTHQVALDGMADQLEALLNRREGLMRKMSGEK